jgi:hypothetical protein
MTTFKLDKLTLNKVNTNPADLNYNITGLYHQPGTNSVQLTPIIDIPNTRIHFYTDESDRQKNSRNFL